jgi:hypothetical protein
MYKDSTIEKINNLKINQTMRLGRCTIKCVPYSIFGSEKHGHYDCYDCIFYEKSKECGKLRCSTKVYIKL